MNINQILTLIFLIVILGCNTVKKQDNQFLSSDDTLYVKTEKVKGFGMFPAGAGQINFKDTTERYEYPVIFPKNITGIK